MLNAAIPRVSFFNFSVSVGSISNSIEGEDGLANFIVLPSAFRVPSITFNSVSIVSSEEGSAPNETYDNPLVQTLISPYPAGIKVR